jgi:hypothetical protein
MEFKTVLLLIMIAGTLVVGILSGMLMERLRWIGRIRDGELRHTERTTD